MRFFRWVGALVVVGGFMGLVALTGVYFYLAPKLPSITSLKDMHLQVPLRVYTRDGQLVAEFGEKRRDPLSLGQIPKGMIDAMLAAEDDRFFEHPGVDWRGLARAVVHLISTGEKGPGGSTITMQVARNFFLGREKTFVRKANEILLALKIEREISKDEILELYLNKIFLGQRAYGVGAAAKVYYGMPIEQLSLEQFAMIAGLAPAPSQINPIANPERALERRNYVLGRMRELGFIDDARYEEAVSSPGTAELHGLSVEVSADYVAEMVRAQMEARYGESAYTEGYKVYTSIEARLQEVANVALRNALLDYDQRHGYRGAELHVDTTAPDFDRDSVLKDVPTVGGLEPALVTAVHEQSATVYSRTRGKLGLDWEALSWARAYMDEDRRGPTLKKASEVLQVGDVIRLQGVETGWRMAQVPLIEGAFVSIDPSDGAILALAGGFDFFRSKFNRVVQAQRQPGSSFKPFIYSAALNHGYTPASLIMDAPIVLDDPGLEAEWRPENYSGEFFGPTRLRVALTKSRNVVSVRLLRAIGVDYAVDYIASFGLDVARLPRNLSLALGTGTMTPLELASGYSVLANGGYRVGPYFIDRIVDDDGNRLFEAEPARVCRGCDEGSAALGPESVMSAAIGLADAEPEVAPDDSEDLDTETSPAMSVERVAPRVISATNAWLMNSMMRDVIRFGTGRRALELGRDDLAGKTGTTNDQRDAWFSGFNTKLVATAWVGFDEQHALGRQETGSKAALPMWMAFMKEALKGEPSALLEQPEGLVSVRIDPETGQRVPAGHPNAIFEMFPTELVPKNALEVVTSTGTGSSADEKKVVREQLF